MLGKEVVSSTPNVRDLSRLEIALRSALILIQVGAAYLLAEQVSPFFYQQF